MFFYWLGVVFLISATAGTIVTIAYAVEWGPIYLLWLSVSLPVFIIGIALTHNALEPIP